MLQSLPNEVLEKHVCAFLVNDGVSLARLSLCSTSLYQNLAINNKDLWKRLICHRWSSTASTHVAAVLNLNLDDDTDPRRIYGYRHGLDEQAKEILDRMTLDLKLSLDLPCDKNTLDGNHLVGKTWNHARWGELLALRGNAADFLREQAQKGVLFEGTTTIRMNASAIGLDERLRSYVAARSLQTVQFAECLYEWRSIRGLVLLQPEDQQEGQADNHVPIFDSTSKALLLERYALLINDSLQTSDRFIGWRRGCETVRQSVVRRLDQLAEACQVLIRDQEETIMQSLHRTLSTMEKIQIINHHIFHQEGFNGNSADYYNYKNSLLDSVLDSKLGIPITLAILYSCVCRRLGVPVYLVGLPGHVVVGFSTKETNDDDDNNDNYYSDVHYIDVFRQGELLTKNDCQRICLANNVTFLDKYMEPLPADQVYLRILNNLTNCLLHNPEAGNEPFHSDLDFYLYALTLIHMKPPIIAARMFEHVVQGIPLKLSPGLLRFYGLLSPRMA